MKKLQRSFDHFIQNTKKSLESRYSRIIVPQLLNLLSLGHDFDKVSLNLIVKTALSIQSLNTMTERTRLVLKSQHAFFAQQLEKVELELSSRMESSQELINAFKEVGTTRMRATCQ